MESSLSIPALVNSTLRNLKRTHDQMSNASVNPTPLSRPPFSSTTSASPSRSSIFSSLSNVTMPNLRFPGDGLDFRRPAAAPVRAPAANIIDLTEDNSADEVHPRARPSARASSLSTTSQPNNGRLTFPDFIDLDEESTRATIGSSSETPDLELLGVRSIRSQPRSATEAHLRQENRHVRANLRPPSPSHDPADHASTIVPVGGRGALQQHAQLGRERQQQLAQQTARQFHQLLTSNHPDPIANTLLRHEGRDIILPGDLDFVTQGFRMGDAPVTRQVPPPLPTYDAPSPPRAGFTRSPKEDDALVCPNCEDELGLGNDDIKRQVWVIKACGHVREVCLLERANRLTGIGLLRPVY
ncbi:MAG: hypothetical protein LQ346_002909 [Caloplaca aetnensis]|nr:MAG: hypothetical protein LQ346_002909 [Caloplaca aetnensis]